MTNRKDLKKMALLRQEGALTITWLAQKSGLGPQSLRNLERSGHVTRQTDPGEIKANSMIKLLEIFPQLELSDFSETEMKLRARKAKR